MGHDDGMEEQLQGFEYTGKVRVIKGVKDRNLVAILGLLVLLLLIGLIVAVVVLRRSNTTNNGINSGNVCTKAHCYTTSAEILSTINTSVNPCNDFFQYACGTWMANHDIPDDRSRYMTFTVVSERNEKVLRKLLSAPITSKIGAGEKKAMQYYQSCFNDIYTEKESRNELIRRIGMLGGWSVVPSIMIVDLSKWNYNQVLTSIASGYDINPLFRIWVSSDLRDAKTTIIEMSQGGITLPGVRYYTYNETHSAVVALIQYMTDVAMILGATNRTKTMQKMTNVYRFEKQLARAYISNLNNKNEELRYNKVNVSQIKAACPAVDFDTYLKGLFKRAIPNNQPVINYAMSYFKRMSTIVSSASNETLNNYLLWHFIKTFTSAADSRLNGAYQKYREALYGKSTPSPQWRTCVYRADAALGMASGALFVRHSFNGHSRATAHSMVQGIKKAFTDALPSINWMDDATRKVAAEKANSIHDQIGYPDFILNEASLTKFYSSFPVNQSYYFINVIARRIYAMRVNLDQLGKPFNKNRWSMTPSTVNAYYSGNKNQIVFPAGILQSPFYNKNYPKVLNYGGIGAVIGHELTHGFDNNGRRFNKNGDLAHWWNDEDINKFTQLTHCFINQYGNFTYFGLHVNGKLTLGENIADNGGIGQAYRAYHAYIKANGPEPTLPGVPLTNDQLFFVAFARVWCGKETAKSGISLVLTNPHSPHKYRVLGTLRNSKDFAKAFKCPAGSPMNPTKKCKIW